MKQVGLNRKTIKEIQHLQSKNNEEIQYFLKETHFNLSIANASHIKTQEAR